MTMNASSATDAATARPNARARGIAAIVVSAFGFAVMALCVRLCDSCGAPVSSFEKSFFRNAVALAIAGAMFARACRRDRVLLPPNVRAWTTLVLRSALGTAGLVANFYALSHIDIADGQTLNKTAPFFTVVFAWLFLGERISRRQLTALLLAFGGVLLVAKPGFAACGEGFPLAMGLFGGVCAGAAYACLRALRRHDISPSFIIVFFSAFSCLATVPFICADFDPLTFRQVLVLAGAGAGAALGQFGITLAYGYAAPRDIAVFDYTNILFTAAFGYLFFAQVPDLASVAGFAAILSAAWWMSRRRSA